MIKLFDQFPQILTYDVILATKIKQFHQKLPILTKLTLLMAFLTKFMSINLTKIFLDFLRKKLWSLLQILTSEVFWPPKWPNFDQKWPILTKLALLITYFTKFMSINLTEIIFRNILGKIIWPHTPNFDIWRHFGPQNDPIVTISTKNDLFWPNLRHWWNFWPDIFPKTRLK